MKYFAFLFMMHIVVVLMSLLLPVSWSGLEVAGYALFGYGIATLLVSYFYGYKVDKHNLFIVPLSFVPLPFICLALIAVGILDGWGALLIFVLAIYFAVLFFVPTFIASLILHFRKAKRKKQGLPCYSGEKTPKRIMIIGCAVFAVLALFVVGLIMWL